jgi:hypothetical protein
MVWSEGVKQVSRQGLSRLPEIVLRLGIRVMGTVPGFIKKDFPHNPFLRGFLIIALAGDTQEL